MFNVKFPPKITFNKGANDSDPTVFLPYVKQAGGDGNKIFIKYTIVFRQM